MLDNDNEMCLFGRKQGIKPNASMRHGEGQGN